MTSETADLEKKRALMESQGESAWALLQAGDFARAVALYARAIETARQVSDRGAEAIFLSYLAAAHQELQQFEEARECLTRAADLAQEYGLSRAEAQACMLLAEQERDSGHVEQAIQIFLRALEAAYNAQDAMAMEVAFWNLGLLYLERGWAEQASEWFRHALETREETDFRASYLGSLGMAMAELGKYDQAIGYYRSAFDEAAKRSDSRTQAVCRGSEGNAHFELGDMDGALSCYKQALELSRDTNDTRRVASWLGNIGNTLLRKGEIEQAIDHCTQAVETAKTADDSLMQAAHLDSLGDCYVAKGDLASAQDRYQEALQLSKTINDRLGERIYLSNLGRVFQQMGQLQPAFDLLHSAIDLFDEQRSAIKADDLKTSFANRGQELYRDMVRVCLEMGKRVEALEFVGRAKSRALLDLLSNSPIDIGELAEDTDQSLRQLIKKEEELRSQIAHLERLFWQGPPTAETTHRGVAVAPEDSQKLYAEWRETINQLRRRHPNYASLVAASTLRFDEIASLWDTHARDGKTYLLDRSTAIVEFYWTDNYFMSACVWHGAKEPVVHSLFDREKLDSFEADLSSFIEMSATEGWEVPLSICKRLYRMLLEPVLQNIPEGIKRLLVIPHGALHHMPFAALHDGTGYLCQRFSISYLPTISLIRVLARSRDERTEYDGVTGYLVSAISDYSATRKDGVEFSARLRSAAGLDDLTYTMEEAATIFDMSEKQTAKARLLTNQEVKEALPELFREYPVVHFAGHAVFNPEEPLASGLVLADGSILSAAAILQGNVLRTNCGKLLVLSACQTGVNMVTQGGEILGLARALMYAGMPNLVLSLWEVADRSTATLMQDFHRNMIEPAGVDPVLRIAEALRAAQAKAALEGQPVHAWAPFVHMGID